MFYLGNKTDEGRLGVSLELHPCRGSTRAGAPRLRWWHEKLAGASGARGGGAEFCAVAPAVTFAMCAPGGIPSTTRLELPYGCHKFLRPWSVSDNGAFFAKWHELTKRAQDVKVVTVAPRIAAGGLAAVEAALTSVRMGVMRGMDPNANNAVAGSTIGYSATGRPSRSGSNPTRTTRRCFASPSPQATWTRSRGCRRRSSRKFYRDSRRVGAGRARRRGTRTPRCGETHRRVV